MCGGAHLPITQMAFRGEVSVLARPAVPQQLTSNRHWSLNQEPVNEAGSAALSPPPLDPRGRVAVPEEGARGVCGTGHGGTSGIRRKMTSARPYSLGSAVYSNKRRPP